MQSTRNGRWLNAALFVLLGNAFVHGQIPTKCLEIERVLVDACNSACPGAQEGENEMFRFKVGPSPITLTDLEADWATPNPFLGWVQNATTADLTAQLNATITNCGLLVEPLNGVLPAGSSVLGITSTAMCVAGNSFAGLSDTLFVIFQTPGNSLGHFKNTTNGNAVTNTPSGNSDNRVFILYVVSEQCADSVAYNCQQLVNQLGSYGGGSAVNDGSSLQVQWPGTPVVSYVNDGCQAPFAALGAEIITEAPTVECGGTIQLEAVTTGNVASMFWSGGTGIISTPTLTVTAYTLGADEVSGTDLSFCVVSACGDTICDTIELGVSGGVSVSITPEGPIALCAGSSVELTATGGPSFVWSTGETASSISVSAAGTVSVSATNACGTATDEVEILLSAGPVAAIIGPTTLCADATGELIASGGVTYAWNTGAQGAVLSITGPGTYSVTATNECGSDVASFTVTPGSALAPSFTYSEPTGCAPLCVEFSTAALEDAELRWTFGDGTTAEGLTVEHCFQAGTFDVALSAVPSGYSTLCAADTTLFSLITAWPTPVARFISDPLVTSMDAPDVRFTSTSTDADEVTFLLYTEPLVDTTTFTFVHPFQAAGCYAVELRATNVHGCADDLSDEYCVEEAFAMWVPNAFTPNGDGINDVFGAVTSLTGTYRAEMQVYDRWGSMIFSTADIVGGWDGSNTMDGVYAWRIGAQDRQGKWRERTGHVVLIR
ncbi:MAG: gliding motility-associated C-terminal domain-containing protein [Flavobacteriales bacterium]|nr:gliding motility-associated C-terminal domain-containing protein [Flavobacteriales bacterium]